MKKYIVSFLISLLIPFLFWMGGFNFDTRGGVALFCAALSITTFVIALAIFMEFECYE